MSERAAVSDEKKKFSTFRVIAAAFAAAVLVGTVLLMLPVSSAEGSLTPFVDALFTSTTSVCVTGLVTVTTASYWSMFGQIVILVLIQLGGLGVITAAMCVLAVLRKHIGLKERMLLQETYNTDTFSGLTNLIGRIVRGTFIIEAVGVILYGIAYIPEYGFSSGIWRAIFGSISAFCNAGMDVIGDASLTAYVQNPLVNITTMLLVILGGLGFVVWWNLIDSWKKRKEGRGFLGGITLHTKLVLIMTAALSVGGAIVFFLLEHDNAATIGTMNTGGKIMASLFQSVTTRTAGFATLDQAQLTGGSTLLTMVLMVIGGSPAGTAGGIKTTTAGILILVIWSNIRGRRDTEFMGRRVSSDTSRTALTVVGLAFIVIITASVLLFATDGFGFTDTLFEVCSAMGTVGLTRGITPLLSAAGKIIIVIVMYMGRIGPVTVAFAVASRRGGNDTGRRLPEERILIG